MILPACVFVHCLHAVPRGQRGWKSPLNWRNRQLWIAIWVLGNKPGFSGRATVLSPPQDRFSLCSPGWPQTQRSNCLCLLSATLPSSSCPMCSRGAPVSSCRKTGPESNCRATKWHTRRCKSTWKCFGGLVLAMSQVSVSMYPPTAFFVLNTMLTNSMKFKKKKRLHTIIVCSNVPHDTAPNTNSTIRSWGNEGGGHKKVLFLFFFFLRHCSQS